MRKRKRPKTQEDVLGPTPEQAARSCFVIGDVLDRDGAGARRIGKAYRRVRMVEMLHKRGSITDEQARALLHYRHHADMIDRSPVRDSLNQQRGGSGVGPTVAMLNAARIVGDCERAAGTLRHMLRAVIVDDVTLSEWAMSRGGGRDMATLEMRMLAGRVMAELTA